MSYSCTMRVKPGIKASKCVEKVLVYLDRLQITSLYIYICVYLNSLHCITFVYIYIYKNDLTLLSFVLYYCFVLYSKLHSIMFIYLYIYICYYVILHNVMHACKYVCAYVCTSVCTFIYLYIYIYIYEFGCKPPMFVCHLHGRNRKRINHEILVS